MKKNYVKILICMLTLTAVAVASYSMHSIDHDKLKAYFSSFSFSDEFDDVMPLSTENFDRLNSTEKTAYVSILNNIKAHPEYIKVLDLSTEEFRNVYFAVKNDNPDILCFPDACNMVSFMSANFIRIEYKQSAEICNSMMTELDKKLTDIAAGIEADDEYSAELIIHDYIVNNCKYDEDAPNGSSAYGCLIENKAICSGYSRAAMLLLNKVGIRSVLVSGLGVTSEQEDISHMWNIVWIDCEPYHLDVTWDDQDLENSVLSHLFFNLSTEQIASTHKDISIDIECVATSANYFVKENLLFDKYDNKTLRTVADSLISNISSGKYYVEFRFSDAQAYETAVSAILDNTSVNTDMYAIIRHIAENTDNIIDTSHINTVTENQQKYIRLMFDRYRGDCFG